MKRWQKWLVALGAAVILSTALLCLAGWLIFGRSGKSVPSNIVDFKPSLFPATADKKFLYSIGNDLKYSDRIDSHAPSLVHGEIREFLVSPDRNKIAVVTKGKLLIVGTESVIREVTPVDSIYRAPKPVGRAFFRDGDFQWSEDSKYLYLIRDQYYNSTGSQLFSDKGELWKYEIESGNLQLVLKPFPAYKYFFVGSKIYFSVPTPRGALQLKCFDGHTTTDVEEPDQTNIDFEKSSRNSVEAPFYSFSIHDYEQALRVSKQAILVVNAENTLKTLMIENKPYLTVTRGENLKGAYYCAEMLRSTFLPGDRYFLLNVDYCGNYEGQLLIDTVTGKYEQLPLHSVIYMTLNTRTYAHYRITEGGLNIN